MVVVVVVVVVVVQGGAISLANSNSSPTNLRYVTCVDVNLEVSFLKSRTLNCGGGLRECEDKQVSQKQSSKKVFDFDF